VDGKLRRGVPKHEQFAALYESGMAYGHRPDIKTDTMHFQYRDEEYELPLTTEVWRAVEFTGYFYQMPIKKLREFAQKK